MSTKTISILTTLFMCLFIVSSYADDTTSNNLADLTVTVTNIKNTKCITKNTPCTLKIALFDSEKAYRKSDDDASAAFKKASIPVNSSGKIIAVFKNIPSGTYAIKLFQDVDNSGAIQTDWLGRPKEDFGFSNNIDASSGAPNFDQVKFNFDKAHANQTIKMQNALVPLK